VEHVKLQFVLKGFTEMQGFRVFAFEGIAADRTRSIFTVRANLALSRRYGIQLQELPLLCRAVLDRSSDGEEKRAFAYDEEDMRVHAATAAAKAIAAKQRKMPRKPVTERVGAAWRSPQR
jgi:hypothetical protein